MSNSFATPWTVARQAPLSMEFPRQEYWSGLPFPSPGDLPKSGVKPGSPALQAEPPGKPNKASITLQSWRHFMVIKKMPPRGFPGGPVAKMLCSQCRGPEFDPWSSNCGKGNGTPLRYSCLENPMDGGAWWAAVHGVVKSWTRLSDFTFSFHFHALEKEMATHSSVLAWRIPGTGEPGGLRSMGLHRVGHN